MVPRLCITLVSDFIPHTRHSLQHDKCCKCAWECCDMIKMNVVISGFVTEGKTAANSPSATINDKMLTLQKWWTLACMHNCNDSFLFFLSLSVVTPAFHIGLFSSTQLLYKRKKKKTCPSQIALCQSFIPENPAPKTPHITACSKCSPPQTLRYENHSCP